MTEFDLNSLNDAQLEALNEVQGAVLVTAGAGSGKTRLLTHRIVHLIKNINVSPENILAITFTNKASNEMKERISRMLPDASERVWISTFHSMCARILRANIKYLNEGLDSNFSIYSDSESGKVINEILAGRGLEKDEQLKKTISYHLSNFKNNYYSLDMYESEFAYEKDINLIVSIIKQYQKKLTENNALDFDDLLLTTHKLFKNVPEVLNKYATRFEYVLVDEFQDTNEIQYELVKMLSQVHKNIFVVGDEDQCIYTWRGANFKNIFKFKDDFENVKVFKLEKNYRSTKTILNYANKLIKNNKSRIDKNLWSEIEGTASVEKMEFYDQQGEAEYVARTIYNLVHNEGYKYKDFAILMRLNALSLNFEERLLSYNIPHKIFGGYKFYERVEVKNVLAYLKLFVNQKDEQAFLRVINFPKRGIGDSTILKLKQLSQTKSASLLEICLNSSEFDLPASITIKLNAFIQIYKRLFTEYETTPLDEFVINVIKEFGIRNAYSSNSVEDTDKLMNIDQLVSSIQAFYSKNKTATLSDYLQNVSLISDIDSLDEENNNVVVATVHSVKGLEFRGVFIIGLEEKIFPISRAYGKDEEMEEERRLLYVGITRAKENLFLTNCKARYLYGKRNDMLPSRFLKELGFESGKQEFRGVREQVASFSQNRTGKSKQSSQFDFVKKRLNEVFYSSRNSNDNNFNSKLINEDTLTKTDISIYKTGKIVLHPKFGIGTIVSIDKEAKCADIDFHTIGVKTLMLEIAPLKIVK